MIESNHDGEMYLSAVVKGGAAWQSRIHEVSFKISHSFFLKQFTFLYKESLLQKISRIHK